MITAYPQPNKARSRAVLEAFIIGNRGAIANEACPVLRPGGAAFYGVVGIEHLLRLAEAEKRDWYYGDNAFFDVARGKYFRFARREIQRSTLSKPEHARLRALDLKVQPWKKSGRHIVVVEQSEHFLSLVGASGWLRLMVAGIVKHSDRPVVIRRWSRDKARAAATLARDLQDAHALVTHMSAAANEALLSGVPVFCSGPCAASPMASRPLAMLESPSYPEGREDWAAGLAGAQWTLDELRMGHAMRYFNDEERA